MSVIHLHRIFADIDECMTEVHSCDINGLCNNTDGGFRCDCLSGYQGNGFICESKFLSLQYKINNITW